MSIQNLMLLTTQLNEEVKKKILVVEDNQINAIVLKRILLNYHFEVIIAEDGQKGVEAVKTHIPDLILMDINMPVMNGIDATVAIRNLEGELKNIPIFAVSADITSNTQTTALESGMNEYITKPVEVELMINLLLQYLR